MNDKCEMTNFNSQLKSLPEKMEYSTVPDTAYQLLSVVTKIEPKIETEIPSSYSDYCDIDGELVKQEPQEENEIDIDDTQLFIKQEEESSLSLPRSLINPEEVIVFSDNPFSFDSRNHIDSGDDAPLEDPLGDSNLQKESSLFVSEEDLNLLNVPSYVGDSRHDAKLKDKGSSSTKPNTGGNKDGEKTPRYSCDICSDMTFTLMKTFLNHMINVHENTTTEKEKTRRCYKCSKGYVSKYMYKRHVNIHKVAKKKPFSCPVCEMRFLKTEKDRLQRHIIANHQSYECQHCKTIFETNFDLRKHERNEHPNIFTHCCMICKNKYSTESFLETHLNTHIDEGPYLCTICPTSIYVYYQSKKSLAKHLRRHTGESAVYECEECGDTLETSKKLNAHFSKFHDKRKLFVCDHCNQRFGNEILLKSHLKKHQEVKTENDIGNEKQHSCIYCNEQFIKRRKLISHWKTHSECEPINGRFACNLCDKSYVGIVKLIQHVAYIHKSIQVQCHICDKTFATEQTLKVHQEQMHVNNVYKKICYFCRKSFENNELFQHLKTHTKERDV